jgi:osmotically-inducible protein OsmY
MIKTDSQLRQDVVDELAWDPQVGPAEIGVAASNGVVTLGGQVGSYAAKTAALKAAERVAGVRAVADEMKVRLPFASARTDVDIAHAVANALRWDTQVPDSQVKARVDSGWVWLDGEVDWQFQRSAAERAVRFLTGVVGVSNDITIKRNAWAPEVRDRINRALKRNAEIDGARISVEAADGKVTLKGRVHSWSARSDAEHAAWSAPGVTSVKDELVVQA